MKKKILQLYILIAIFAGFLSLGTSCYAEEEGLVSKDEIVQLTNEERKKVGLPELKSNEVLEEAAMLKAQDMLEHNYFAHTSPEGVEPWHWFDEAEYKYKYAGENLAMDFTSATSVTRAWMKSPTHRDNIMSNKFQEIGVAVVKGMIDGNETLVAVQLFGTQLGTDQQAILNKLKESTAASMTIDEAAVYPWKGKKIDELLVYAKVTGEPAKVEAIIGDKTFELQQHRDQIYMNLLLAEEAQLLENNVIIKATLDDQTSVYNEISKEKIASALSKSKDEKKTIVAASKQSSNDNLFKVLVKQNVILSVGLIVLFVIIANIWVLEKEEEKILASYHVA